jgi:hypothetical protein
MRQSKIFMGIATAAILFSVVVFVASCKKNKNTDKTDTTEDVGYASDHSTSEQAFNDVQLIADQSADVTGSLQYKTTGTTAGGCATVTHSGDSIIVDFGPVNCMCRDGRNRRGQIIATFTGGRYADPGSIHTITFNNFYQNDNHITGTKTVTNMGPNSAGQPYFNITIAGSVTKTTGETMTTNWTRVRTWTAGYTTLGDKTDDVYEVTGTGTLTRASGAVVNVNIPAATPLVFAQSCRWIEAGSVTYTLSTGQTRTLNYGTTPACDNAATMTLASGAVRTITLP